MIQFYKNVACINSTTTHTTLFFLTPNQLLVALEKNMATHLAMQKACALAQANMTGLSIWAMAAKTYCRPAVPPGRKLIRYHNKATSCAAEDPSTMT